MNRLSRTRLLCVLGVVVAGGCTADTNPTSSRELGLSAQEVPTDPEINPNDTYVVLDAQITSTSTATLAEPITDPATGQTVTQLTLPDAVDTQFRLEAGYDGSGVLRMTLSGQWATSLDPVAQSVPDARTLVISGGQLYEYSSTGAPVPAPIPSDSMPSATQLLTDLGSELLYGNITEGILLDSIRAEPQPQRRGGTGD